MEGPRTIRAGEPWAFLVKVSLNTNQNYTQEVSLTQLPKLDVNKDTNTHASKEAEKLKRNQS